MEHKNFTLGFIFSPSFDRVLLMHKNRPDWQAGKVNGIGGKVEGDESLVACMVRETFEETGLNIPDEKWSQVGQFGADTWTVFVYCSVFTGDQASIESKTDERVEWFRVDQIPENAIENLNWMIPICVDKLKDPTFGSFVVNYHRT